VARVAAEGRASWAYVYIAPQREEVKPSARAAAGAASAHAVRELKGVPRVSAEDQIEHARQARGGHVEFWPPSARRQVRKARICRNGEGEALAICRARRASGKDAGRMRALHANDRGRRLTWRRSRAGCPSVRTLFAGSARGPDRALWASGSGPAVDGRPATRCQARRGVRAGAAARARLWRSGCARGADRRPRRALHGAPRALRMARQGLAVLPHAGISMPRHAAYANG
jgi:hypothetical protein